MRILDEQERVRRKNRLLQAVILEYIRTAAPVASAAISHQDEMDLSAATIRNLLHDMEEEGLLTHPHTSAGRQPTDKGYRYYVDYLLNLQALLEEEERKIEEEYRRRIGELETVLSRTSHMLAYLSHHAGFVLQPKLDSSTLSRLELIPSDDGQVLLVLVAKNGLVRYKLIKTAGTWPEEDLKRMTGWINQRFKGKNLRELCLHFEDDLRREYENEKSKFMDIASILAEPISLIAEPGSVDTLFLEGQGNLLLSAEFTQAPAELRHLAQTLEDRHAMLGLIKKEIQQAERKSPKKDVAVVIGEESKTPMLRDLSLVAKTFEAKEHLVGVLGILGPKRMEYARMVSLVEAIHTALQRALRSWD